MYSVVYVRTLIIETNNNITTETMTHLINSQIEKLESLKRQINYCNNAINSDIDEWEKKEYRSLLTDLKNDVESIECSLKKINS